MPMGVVFIKKCDVKGGGCQKVNVIVTLRSAKVVWKCPPTRRFKACKMLLSPKTFNNIHLVGLVHVTLGTYVALC